MNDAEASSIWLPHLRKVNVISATYFNCQTLKLNNVNSDDDCQERDVYNLHPAQDIIPKAEAGVIAQNAT